MPNITPAGPNAAVSSGFGGNKSVSSNAPVGANTTGAGHANWGVNDNATQAITGGGLTGIAGLALATLQFLIAEKQYELANDYYKSNKTDFDFYQQNYANFAVDGNGNIAGSGIGSGPLVTHKDQAFTAPPYVADYLTMSSILGRTKIYDEKWFQARRRMPRYNTGLVDHADYKFYTERRRAATSAYLTGRRFEDARKDWKDEQAHTHKVQALNFGITAGNIARQGLASAVGTLEHAYDDLGSRLGGISSGLGRLGGYNSGKSGATAALNKSSNDGSAMAPQAIGHER